MDWAILIFEILLAVAVFLIGLFVKNYLPYGETMPYNYKGDLYKREIVKKLQDVGLDVKSVNALNKIMEKMGLLIHYGNGWGTTDAGAKFSMWHKGVLNSDSWHPELVDEIAKFLKK